MSTHNEAVFLQLSTDIEAVFLHILTHIEAFFLHLHSYKNFLDKKHAFRKGLDSVQTVGKCLPELYRGPM
jgi:hypothetical protein